MERHDMDAFGKLFAADAHFVNVRGVRWIGREEITKGHAAAHATIFKTSTLRIESTTVHFLKSDLATARLVCTLTGQISPAGRLAPPRTTILTHVLVRAAGHWLIVLSQNTDVAAPAG